MKLNLCFELLMLFITLFASQSQMQQLYSLYAAQHNMPFPTLPTTQNNHFKLITSNWYKSNRDENHAFIFYIPENFPDHLNAYTCIYGIYC